MNLERGFESAFVRALQAPPGEVGYLHAGPWADVFRQPAFAVYRNGVLKACVDALEANFPAVVRLVGHDWFRAAAAQYASSHPPGDARLLNYGDEGFGDWLQALPSTAHLPYLRGVASLDAMWRQVHAAADAPCLDAARIARMDADRLGCCVLRLHPAARWAWFDGLPVASIWSREREQADPDAAMAWQGEGVLFTRPHAEVRWRPAGPAACAFLEACAQARTLDQAARAALACDAGVDLSTLMRDLLVAGACSELEMQA